MNTTDFLRYNRQMNLKEVGVEGQLKFKEARVLVIGTGGLGSPILTYLATCGVGHLAAIDFDVVEHHNLHRQILFTEADIGRPKIEVAQERIQRLNPHILFKGYGEKLTSENSLSIIADYDVIVDGSDNFATRYLVNDSCVALGKPLVYGTILDFEGQIAVFNYRGSKNLRDLFPAPPPPDRVPNCSLNGVLGTFPGIIGNMMAHETLKVLLDLEVAYNQLLLVDTKSWSMTKLNF